MLDSFNIASRILEQSRRSRTAFKQILDILQAHIFQQAAQVRLGYQILPTSHVLQAIRRYLPSTEAKVT